MGGGFNIAVAEFAMIDASGHVTSSEVGLQFSNDLFETIETDVKRLPPALSIELRKPEDVGLVGDDECAEEKATDINATILIYGYVRLDADGFYEIEPKFHILDKAAFNYGSEVTGPERLGRSISELTLDQEGRFNFNVKLNSRTQALKFIVTGLAHFFIGEYESAVFDFQKAIDTPDWDPQDGQEVAYLLLGTAQLRSWDLIQNPDVLSLAADAFTEANFLKPNYYRSHLGLGAVALAQAQELNSERTGIGSVDIEKLNEAIEWFSAGLDHDHPPQAYIPTKSAFGLGQTYLLGAEFNILDNAHESASAFFEQVIDQYRDENNTVDLNWFAAHAYAGLGRLAGLDGNWAVMSEEYRQAIIILESIQPNPPNLWIARFWSYAGFAEEKLTNQTQAREFYERAISAGEGVVSAEEMEGWRLVTDRLKQGSP
jgi:tetratricopeptide (TPR) repeat protein